MTKRATKTQSAGETIHALIAALGPAESPAQIERIEITEEAVRVIRSDRSMRTYRIDDWKEQPE